MSGFHGTAGETNDGRTTRTARRRSAGCGAALATGLAAMAVIAPAALPTGPTTKPVPNTTSVFPAKKACPFKVIDKTLPDSRRTETIFRDGRHVVSGPGREKLTNAGSGASIVVDSSGTVSFKKGPDGKTRFRFTGPNVLYFYPGDQGPFGEVGENGALYHLIGKVGETLAKDGTVTAFAFKGTGRELCHRIA